jgi:hypothetical protein
MQALQALEVPTVTKQEGGWPAVCDVLIRGAVQHEQLDFVAAALMERARKHEHVPLLAAQAAKDAEEKYNSTQLVSLCALHLSTQTASLSASNAAIVGRCAGGRKFCC